MPADALIGLDLGTSAVKAGVVSGAGALLTRYHAPYPTTRTNGLAEQDPQDWLDRIHAALAKFAAEGHSAAALGICAQVNTHVFVDRDGQPLLPAIPWQDGRAAAEAAELDAQVSDAQKIAWWGTPMPIDASHALPRMLWLARHHPDLWERTAHVLLPKDFCLLHLTGTLVSDPLSNVGLVGEDSTHVEALFDLVPGARARMVPLATPAQRIGHLRAGLPLAGTPVVAGTMDAWSGLVGAGAAQEGASVYLSGTSEILGVSSRRVIPTPGAIVFPESAGIRVHAAPTQSGGDAQLWYAEAHGLSLPQMSALVAATPRSAATPLFLPQLEGERAPLWDASLRGAFLNVSRRTGQGDFARAVYEGVAFAARWALETLEASSGVTGDTVLCGGNGFLSEPWGQIRADVMGKQLRRLAAGEPGVIGAAMLAATGTGAFADMAEAFRALARFDLTFEPDAPRHAAYCDLSDRYREAIDLVAGLNASVARAGARLG